MPAHSHRVCPDSILYRAVSIYGRSGQGAAGLPVPPMATAFILRSINKHRCFPAGPFACQGGSRCGIINCPAFNWGTQHPYYRSDSPFIFGELKGAG